jgi:hypothetical protein
MNECSHWTRGKCEPCEQKGYCYYRRRSCVARRRFLRRTDTRVRYLQAWIGPRTIQRRPGQHFAHDDTFSGLGVLPRTPAEGVVPTTAATRAEQIRLTLFIDRYTYPSGHSGAGVVVTQAHRGPARAEGMGCVRRMLAQRKLVVRVDTVTDAGRVKLLEL